jgi:hypothetical protein
MRAMEAIIVPAFSGEIVQVKWKIDLDAKAEE